MQFEDITYEKPWAMEGAARIMINRPQVYNAFRGKTTVELKEAFEDVNSDDSIGVIVLTGAGDKAFCTGGDAKDVAPGRAGYSPEVKKIVDVHRLIREAPKPVIAAVNGYAIGGGHVLHIVCDLSIASETARFGQVGPRVGSFDAGFGSAYLARVVGEKRAREIWFLCRQYSAQEAYEMGLVNKVVPPDKLEEEVKSWCEEILALSPTALRYLKASFNQFTDSIYGIEAIAMDALWQFYETDEAKEGRAAFLEKRSPDWSRFRRA
jgi:naphthoate synthase